MRGAASHGSRMIGEAMGIEGAFTASGREGIGDGGCGNSFGGGGDGVTNGFGESDTQCSHARQTLHSSGQSHGRVTSDDGSDADSPGAVGRRSTLLPLNPGARAASAGTDPSRCAAHST